MVIGTSLTFYRGYDAHQELLEQLRKETGLPVSTMSEAVVDGLHRRRRQAHRGRDRLCRRGQQPACRFPRADPASRCWRCKGFGLFGFGEPGKKTEQDIIELSGKAIEAAGKPDAVLISCGGLLTLGCAEPIEQRHGIPVVTSTQSAFWKAMRLAGDSGHVAGRGRMLAQSQAVPA